MKNIINIKNLDQHKAIIFDLDGTLYNQEKLKRFISYELIKYYLPRFSQLFEIRIISIFRKEREKHAGEEIDNLDVVQYQWVSEKQNISIEVIREITSQWMIKKPLAYLNRCKYKWVDDTFEFLKQKNILIIIYSDHPASDKMTALQLQADQIYSAVDSEINALKPSTAGINWICERNGLSANQCLFIGDRDDRDGECARKAGMSYYILSPNEKK